MSAMSEAAMSEAAMSEAAMSEAAMSEAAMSEAAFEAMFIRLIPPPEIPPDASAQERMVHLTPPPEIRDEPCWRRAFKKAGDGPRSAAQLACFKLCEAMQNKLPPELRNAIYDYIDPSPTNRMGTIDCIDLECDVLYSFEKTQWHVVAHTSQYMTSVTFKQHWHVKFVGAITLREVAENLYHRATIWYDHYEYCGMFLGQFLDTDHFGLGVTPRPLLKKFVFTGEIDEYCNVTSPKPIPWMTALALSPDLQPGARVRFEMCQHAVPDPAVLAHCVEKTLSTFSQLYKLKQRGVEVEAILWIPGLVYTDKPQCFKIGDRDDTVEERRQFEAYIQTFEWDSEDDW
ncbi:hypothetical protein M011DRAFT_489920 [Sporormia fimetaria CBS 119925]|uniref:Uncharacterized protein n=1 Tax=Sporormia fimetaria CBS 119925 TaxID=1340428 RepID=A0A6A6UYD0_9PLEO|nr:hypothetical protein M011DRAFT_489920 [Sporormia fimetaria CBS 119925]